MKNKGDGASLTGDLFGVSACPDDNLPVKAGQASPPPHDSAQPAEYLVLDYLRRVSGRHFHRSVSSLSPIRSVLNNGFTPEQCCAVIDMKAKEWGPSQKMRKFIRPDALFRLSNFRRYWEEYQMMLEERSTIPDMPTAVRQSLSERDLGDF